MIMGPETKLPAVAVDVSASVILPVLSEGEHMDASDWEIYAVSYTGNRDIWIKKKKQWFKLCPTVAS